VLTLAVDVTWEDLLVRMFGQPQIVLFSKDLPRAGAFYEALGFEEVFRTPLEGPPIHVDLMLDGYRIGLASEASTRDDHGLEPVVRGQRGRDPVERRHPPRLRPPSGAGRDRCEAAGALAGQAPHRLGRGP
jgi:catechol 2,3-dioxygenase-like lactoylglutathione lyase family enzyme